ncbi:hypothetical protein PV08_01613 [Exophiala spinifera]|uniref:BZIP domain-containing protein n=1 Tax=Exophiala spinifera TaxID=91928 RepID=A0A0D2CC48_9EURO|nr:uncharacterized protein PV08_01613 [Exophiala spinifera]KIW21034.1 hypothetical protein PV08_01613 [Exophiala spinifera]
MGAETPASPALDTSSAVAPETAARAEAGAEEADFVPGNLLSLSTTNFPDTFFMNPFAVSFPGDIPCYPEVSMTDSSTATTPSMTWSAIPKTAPPCPTQDASAVEATTCTRSLVNTPASLPTSSQNRPLAADAPRTSATPVYGSSLLLLSSSPSSSTTKVIKTTSNPPAVQGRQIHFVDMADKKGAQRIRNTMNSRKHRQNKLDKIRELEKKLAGLEEEKGKWRERAEGLGWKQA